MAGPYRGQILFNTPDAGWSETYYLPGANIASAISALQTINTARLGLSPSKVTAYALRVVDVTTPRLANLVNPTTLTGTWAADGATPVDPSIAVLARMNSADGLTRSRHFLRGLGQSALSDLDPLTFSFTGAYATALTNWVNAVIANANLGVRTAPHTYTLKAINAISTAPLATIRKAGRPFGQRRGRRTLV